MKGKSKGKDEASCNGMTRGRRCRVQKTDCCDNTMVDGAWDNRLPVALDTGFIDRTLQSSITLVAAKPLYTSISQKQEASSAVDCIASAARRCESRIEFRG